MYIGVYMYMSERLVVIFLVKIAILVNHNTSVAFWPDVASELTLAITDLLLPPDDLLLVLGS